ncbi:MAG: hypothetical protein LBK73_06535 [Treponema sp.]|jgi:hypothetical protein|nr:hypothetical protein [Treponema sp.]
MKNRERQLALAALFMALRAGTVAAKDNLAAPPFTGEVNKAFAAHTPLRHGLSGRHSG